MNPNTVSDTTRDPARDPARGGVPHTVVDRTSEPLPSGRLAGERPARGRLPVPVPVLVGLGSAIGALAARLLAHRLGPAVTIELPTATLALLLAVLAVIAGWYAGLAGTGRGALLAALLAIGVGAFEVALVPALVLLSAATLTCRTRRTRR